MKVDQALKETQTSSSVAFYHSDSHLSRHNEIKSLYLLYTQYETNDQGQKKSFPGLVVLREEYDGFQSHPLETMEYTEPETIREVLEGKRLLATTRSVAAKHDGIYIDKLLETMQRLSL